MEQEVERIIKYTKKRKLSSIQKKKHVFYGMNKFKKYRKKQQLYLVLWASSKLWIMGPTASTVYLLNRGEKIKYVFYIFHKIQTNFLFFNISIIAIKRTHLLAFWYK